MSQGIKQPRSDAERQKVGRVFTWGGAALLLTGVVIHLGAEGQRRSVASAHAMAVAARERDWERERAQREATAAAAARDRADRRRREIEEAVGGPAAAAAVARGCASPGTRVRVKVDRFTEFTVTLELPGPASASELAGLAHCILAFRAGYIHRLQFAWNGRIERELDRSAIEFVADGREVTVARLEPLLVLGGRSEAPSAPTSRASAREASVNLTAEGRRQETARRKFQASQEAAQSDLIAAVERFHRATDFGGGATASRLDLRRAELKEAMVLVERARPVMEDPAAYYGRELDGAGVDPVFSRGAVRTMAATENRVRPHTVEMFRQIVGALQEANAFLDVLERYANEWEYEAARRVFRFATQSAHDEIGAMMGRLEQQQRAWKTATTRRNEALKEAEASAGGR